jgi:hypothetical protein
MAGINGFPGFITDFVRGTTKDFTIVLGLGQNPIDITDCKFYITFVTKISPSEIPVLEITIDSPTDPLNGTTTGTITDEQTYSLEARKYYYSVRFEKQNGATYVIDMGKVTVFEAITNKGVTL